MNPNTKKLGIFAGAMFSHGFYRSLISRPVRDYDNCHEKEILTDKIIRATLSGILYSTWYFPISVYQTIGRTEVFLRGKNPHEYSYLYSEPFLYTTLEKTKEEKLKVSCK